MSAARNLIHEFTTLPGLMRLGLLILAVGGTLDIIYHAVPSGWIEILDIYLGEHSDLAHWVTLAGMLVTLIGVFTASSSMHTVPDQETRAERRGDIE